VNDILQQLQLTVTTYAKADFIDWYVLCPVSIRPGTLDSSLHAAQIIIPGYLESSYNL